MTESLIWSAFWMGILSAVSLPLGALTARFWTPGDRATAVLMAFGGGALLAALTIDLVGAALERGHFNTLAIGAVCGGLLFVALNLLVNDFGGFVRKTSTTFYHLRRQEHRQLKRVMGQVTRTELFQALEDADCKVLAASARSQDYPRGSVIFEAADPADAAYILVSGTVEIYDAADRSRLLARLGPNEIFGWYSTLTGAPTSDTAVATSDASVWVIPRESLDGLQRASNAYVQAVHRRLREPATLDYLVQRQGMTRAAAESWLDQAAQSLLRNGSIPKPGPASHRVATVRSELRDLRRFPLFQRLPDAELDLIADHLLRKVHAKGEHLFAQGQPASRFFIIEQGQVSLVDPAHAHLGSEPLGPGDALGGFSFLTGASHTKTAVTTEETIVWELRRRDLDEILRRLPGLIEAIRAFLAEGEAERYLTERVRLSAERATRWRQAARHALELRQPMPAVASLSLSHAQHGGAPLAIFLGITLDGIPESLVIGSSMLHAAISVSLIVGLFLSNYPEALSSSVGMRQQGMDFGRILGMWSGLMLITGIGAAAGSVFFAGADPHLFAFVEGLAAGAMLTMIAETMLPEAYLKGGNVIGLSTLAGFLIAIFSKTLEPADAAQHGRIAPPQEQEVPALRLQERRVEPARSGSSTRKVRPSMS
ncbi:cyclic nucleotide-binding domain-containing protein [Thiocystis violascens]|uniref:Cyclic nucleotide-binding protein n=1 Tax=Thiocystis violascens (strain ATCC 17096 / DSM 198 / 6111) TaxID=765911 RepID=I3Y7P8_THIV6|nr:cyclic nucleotide-binding domain-containing protein [Thiocystis violascens]AFL73016.1 cyclic nucleotide-binding protein [Thiocystis violascens DSM 198]